MARYPTECGLRWRRRSPRTATPDTKTRAATGELDDSSAQGIG